MKLALFATCLSPLLLQPATDFASTYSEGEIRTTTFSLEYESDTTDIEILVNGDAMEGDMAQRQLLNRSATFTDVITKVGEGSPSAFERTYDNLTSEASWFITDPRGEEEMHGSGDSELEGMTIVFNRGEEGYELSFAKGEENDGDLLENLEPLLDWSGFLPTESADVDAEWEIEPVLIRQALHLGGSLAFDGVGDEDSIKLLTLTEGMYLGRGHKTGGEVTAKLTKVEDGLATIEFEVELSEELDLKELITTLASSAEEDAPEGASMTQTTEYEGDGTLVWNVDEGVAVSLELDLSFENELHILMPNEMGGRSMEMEQTWASEGEMQLSIKVEVSQK